MARYEDIIKNTNSSISTARKELNNLSSKVNSNKKAFDGAKSTIKSWGNSLISSIDNALIKIGKFTLATASLGTGFAIKTGFEASFNLEAYRTQLETAVKDTEKTTKLMQMAQDLSIVTPFTPEEVIQSTANLEAYGVDSTKWLSQIADMAGATNKSMEQATGALIDVLNKNEYQTIEEFGISKELLMSEATKKYGKNKVFSKKGEVKDQEKLKELLTTVMTNKFDGGAEKLSQTVKGLWSTITGSISMSLAKIFGMENGLIKTGSLLDLVRNKIKLVADTLTQWQTDGTLDEISKKFTETFNHVLELISNVYNFLKNNSDTIMSILKIATAVYTFAKTLIFISQVISAIQLIMTVLNATMLASPIGWIVLGITALIGVIYLVIKGFSSIINLIKKAWTFIKEFAKGMPWWAKMLTLPLQGILKLIEAIKSLINLPGKAFKWFKNIFNIGNDTEKEIKVNKAVVNKENQEALPIVNNSFIQNKREKNKPSEINKTFNITINGDVYGFEDFEEKIAEVLVKIYEVDIQNAV